MGTPVRNATNPSTHPTQCQKVIAAAAAAEAAVSPPFVIEWRQSRSPDVVISPADAGNKKAIRHARGAIGAAGAKITRVTGSSSAVETPHHASLTSITSKNLNTPDDAEDHIPTKKPKPVRLETLLELKSVVTAALKRQQPPPTLSPAVEPTSKRIASSSNDSLNDDSYNQLLSQIVDSVDNTEKPDTGYNPFCSPVQKTYLPPPRQFHETDGLSATTSTPLRRGVSAKSKISTPKILANVAIDKGGQCSDFPKIAPKVESKTTTTLPLKPPVVYDVEEDDDFDAVILLAALEKAEESSNSHDDVSSWKSTNSCSSSENIEPKDHVKPTARTTIVPVSLKADPPVFSSSKSNNLSKPDPNENKSGGLSSVEKAAIEAKRLAALSKLQNRGQTFLPPAAMASANVSTSTTRSFNQQNFQPPATNGQQTRAVTSTTTRFQPFKPSTTASTSIVNLQKR